jgi:hypothetical protein
LGFQTSEAEGVSLILLFKHTWVLVSRINDVKDLHFLLKQQDERRPTMQILKKVQNVTQGQKVPNQLTFNRCHSIVKQQKHPFVVMPQRRKDTKYTIYYHLQCFEAIPSISIVHSA